jgi:cytochrome c
MSMRLRHALLAMLATFALSGTASAQDAVRGKVLFEQCVACHSLKPGHNETGPHLHGLFGRKSAGVHDYVYSPPLRRADIVWTPALLDSFLAEPQSGPFRGNKMPFAGIPDAQARADLIAYLTQATQ